MYDGNFTHLHVHSEYSLLDGACRIKELVSYVKEIGQTAIAITDHGNMCGVIEFYKEAFKQGIKPIIGCEVYVSPRKRTDKDFNLDKNPYHLTLLCENNTGYRNLVKLVSLGYMEGFYSKPRVDEELLNRYHEGLICLSGCVIGKVARNLLKGEYAEAEKVALSYQKIFGKDNYFLEVQNHGTENELQILPLIYRLSGQTNIPLVATNDVHYTKRSDSDIQDILLCIQTQTVQDDPKRMRFPSQEFYIKSSDEMYNLFKNVPQAIENTQLIADRCNVSIEFEKLKLPKYTHDGISDNTTYLRKLCYAGLTKRYGNNPSSYIVSRMNYELSVIIQMGYVDYYLIVWDYIKYAKEHGIPVGCGRGSGAGSICAYCIGITNVDPIRYSLLFERFLNPERISMPDFDIDFCIEGRSKVIDYVTRRYGVDKVSQIITFGTMAAKSSIRDVGRVMGFTYNLCSKVANYIPNRPNVTINETLVSVPEFNTLYREDPQVKKLVDTAKRLEGMPRNVSTHAAGVIISSVPIMDLVPVRQNDGITVTQYPMNDLESLGFVKIDFLGLRNLTVIKECQDLIKQKYPHFDVDTIPLNDSDVFTMLAQGKTLGVFQFESSGITDVLMRLVPKDLEDLIAVLSLYRPGPMDSIPKYIENRHDPSKISYVTPQLKPILDVTYGCIVYQEQVMEICRTLAGYSYGHADVVRRAMAKKKHDIMMKERDGFIQGCNNNGITKEISNKIFDELIKFSAYAFNKSHATCYAYLSYQTAYLRCHYFTEYMAALMNSVLSNTEKLMDYISECESNGIKVLKPHVNESFERFTASNNCIRFGMLAIKGIGEGMMNHIIQERTENGAYVSIKDFCKRLSDHSEVNRRSIESLIKAGAFDNLGYNRNQMLTSLDGIIKTYFKNSKYYDSVEVEGQLDLFGQMANVANKDYTIPSMEEYPNNELLIMEHDVTGMYISGHPLKEYSIYVDALKLDTIDSIIKTYNDNKNLLDIHINAICYLSDVRIHTTKKNEQMAFISLEGISNSIDGIVFPRIYELVKGILTTDTIVFIDGNVSVKDNGISIILQRVISIEEFIEYPLKHIRKQFYKLVISATRDTIDKTAKLCDNLNAIGGNFPIEVILLDSRQRFIPRSKPMTTLNRYAFNALKNSGIPFKCI